MVYTCVCLSLLSGVIYSKWSDKNIEDLKSNSNDNFLLNQEFHIQTGPSLSCTLKFVHPEEKMVKPGS